MHLIEHAQIQKNTADFFNNYYKSNDTSHYSSRIKMMTTLFLTCSILAIISFVFFTKNCTKFISNINKKQLKSSKNKLIQQQKFHLNESISLIR